LKSASYAGHINHNTTTEQHSAGTAFVLWLSCLFGVCGIHRFYLGKPVTGLLYLLTFGFLGIGQLLDLFWMRDMVLLANTKNRLASGARPKLLPPAQPRPRVNAEEELRVKLLKTANEKGGTLSVSEGVMATGQSFETVEKTLDEMAKSGYVGIDNHPETGAVVYTFNQL
jgi:TM2 domain-containing membrane protein YozV